MIDTEELPLLLALIARAINTGIVAIDNLMGMLGSGRAVIATPELYLMWSSWADFREMAGKDGTIRAWNSRSGYLVEAWRGLIDATDMPGLIRMTNLFQSKWDYRRAVWMKRGCAALLKLGLMGKQPPDTFKPLDTPHLNDDVAHAMTRLGEAQSLAGYRNAVALVTIALLAAGTGGSNGITIVKGDPAARKAIRKENPGPRPKYIGDTWKKCWVSLDYPLVGRRVSGKQSLLCYLWDACTLHDRLKAISQFGQGSRRKAGRPEETVNLSTDIPGVGWLRDFRREEKLLR